MSVYFAEAGPYMKIGYSADPTGRMTTVTRNGTRPDDLPFATDAELIGWIPGDRKVEKRMHERFASIRVAGEWFWSERQDVLDLIYADPRGVDVQGMSALAVFAMVQHPSATRADIEAVGIRVKGASTDEVLAEVSAMFAKANVSKVRRSA